MSAASKNLHIYIVVQLVWRMPSRYSSFYERSRTQSRDPSDPEEIQTSSGIFQDLEPVLRFRGLQRSSLAEDGVFRDGLTLSSPTGAKREITTRLSSRVQ
jgi:hypothetical protein